MCTSMAYQEQSNTQAALVLGSVWPQISMHLYHWWWAWLSRHHHGHSSAEVIYYGSIDIRFQSHLSEKAKWQNKRFEHTDFL